MNAREIKFNFYINIIAAILFTWILQPIGDVFWTFISTTTNKFITNLTSGIYVNAALGQRNWLDFLTLSILMSALYYAALKRTGEVIFDKNPIHFLLTKLMSKLTDKGRDNWHNTSRYMVIVSFLLMSFTIFYFWFSAYADLQMNASFNLRMNAISPYIEEIQEEKLFSSWSLMRGRNDFILINLQIDSIALKNNILLPANLY